MNIWRSIERTPDDGSAALAHLRAGRPIHVSDPRFPGQVVRAHPDGRIELLQLDDAGELVVIGPADTNHQS